MFKDMVRGRLQNHENRIATIEGKQIAVFVDIETGAVYSQEYGVKIPLRREGVHGGAGSGGMTIAIAMGRGGASFGLGGCGVAPQETIMFHRDRAPKCDYAMAMRDGSLKFFKKAEVPADSEVTAAGKIIKVKGKK